MARAGREIPYCTIFLVVGAVSCQTLVLLGNLGTAKLFGDLGNSSRGWAKVGTSLAGSLSLELDPAMGSVVRLLSDTISVAMLIEIGVDEALAVIGSATDAVLMGGLEGVGMGLDLADFRERLLPRLRPLVAGLLEEVKGQVRRLLELIEPALRQLQEWTVAFGERTQHVLEEFGATVDWVQRLFGELLSKLSAGASSNEEEMVFNTFALLDADNSGAVLPEDLRSAAALYGIPALDGGKAEELFHRYHAGPGGLTQQEYALLAHDPSIPGIMTLMLRTYARKLSTVAGQVRSAVMRDELARSVVDYLSLVCVKNMTKVGWVAAALTNGSVPTEFTADVLKDFAIALDNPNKLAVLDVGAAIIGEMMRLNTTHLLEALKLMSSPAFWAAEGFDPQEQPTVVERVAAWVILLPRGASALRHGLQMANKTVLEGSSLPQAVRNATIMRQDRYFARQRSRKAEVAAALYASEAARRLRDGLLAGVSASASRGLGEEETLGRGVCARPETLRFAAWLASNASGDANRFLRVCFDYSGESSGSLESFANQVNGIIKRTQIFLNIMGKYGSARGMELFLVEAGGFVRDASKDVLRVMEAYVDRRLSLHSCKLGGNCTAGEVQQGTPVDHSTSFSFLTVTLKEIKSFLPAAIDSLKDVRREVAAVASTMQLVMDVLEEKAPRIFHRVAGHYRGMWVAYFLSFGLLTSAVLFYGFWAAGWFCGLQASPAADEGYEAPTSLAGRWRACWWACSACLRPCYDGHLSFWSLLLLMELLVLIVFVCAVLLCITGAVQAFAAVGCTQVYTLSDNTICTMALQAVQASLKTFWTSASSAEAPNLSVESVCQGETLLTCKLLAEQLHSRMMRAMLGGLAASALSFQLLVESALQHERAAWRRALGAEAKGPKSE